MARSDCPCGSGLRYSECCRPLHRGEREAADAVALMRSRYSAFAQKEAEYLWRTLAPAHEDRLRPKEEVLRSIKESASANRYMGLKILDSRAPDAAGVAQVLFLARVFRNGRDLSFVECSDFLHDGAGWRYWRGVMKSVASIPGDASALRIDTFSGADGD